MAREYIVVNVPKAGTLEECIAASGKDLTKIRNLKLTGEINSADFAVMRFAMTYLTALNLKEVRIKRRKMEEFVTIEENVDYTLTEKKSKFIANLIRVNSKEVAGNEAFGCYRSAVGFDIGGLQDNGEQLS